MDAVVEVTGGRVAGRSHEGVNAFLGIPYAAPAVGSDRYRAPGPVVPWPGTRDATVHGPTPEQTPYPAPMDAVLPSSVSPGPDYLNVSVWAPAGGRDLPVVVWVPGGAFARGANSIATYDGTAFARDGVVLVGLNYRLGAPGFAVLEGAPTNLGLRDQLAALAWVRDNVAAFGGDPGNVTLVGESAGAMSVATLMASPAARGLFHRAVVQSGGATATCTLDDARLVSGELARLLDVPATAEAFAALDPDTVLAAQTTLSVAVQADPDPARWGSSVLRGGLGIMSLFPVVDGDVVPDVPLARIGAGSAAGMPLLLGTTAEEYRLFLVLDRPGRLGQHRGAAAAGRALRLARRSRRDLLREPAGRLGRRRRQRDPDRRRLPPSRRPPWPRRSTPPGAPCTPTSWRGARPSAASVPATPSSSGSSSTPWAAARRWPARPRRSRWPTRCTARGWPSPATATRAGRRGRRRSRR